MEIPEELWTGEQVGSGNNMPVMRGQEMNLPKPPPGFAVYSLPIRLSTAKCKKCHQILSNIYFVKHGNGDSYCHPCAIKVSMRAQKR